MQRYKIHARVVEQVLRRRVVWVDGEHEHIAMLSKKEKGSKENASVQKL